LLITLAQELGKLPNKISIEGHTDSKPYAASGNYSNWELSTDRANAARRLMQVNGVGVDQVTQVRGFADQRLRKLGDSLDPSNRRVSLIVQYIPKDKDTDQETTKSSTAATQENKPEDKTPAKPSAGTEKKPEANSPSKPTEITAEKK
jgi:chemotaxis protein MotB